MLAGGPESPPYPAAEPGLSPWWLRILLVVLIITSAVLVWISVRTYTDAPPIPTQVVDTAGQVIATRDDIQEGQNVFQKYELMNNGTIWGHGAMLGPDYSAAALHQEVLALDDAIAQRDAHAPYSQLDAQQKAAISGTVRYLLKQNNFNPATGKLTLTEGEAAAWRAAPGQWRAYFTNPAGNGGLHKDFITNPDELRKLAAFFNWTAWASAAHRPGKAYSYTNNFPYDPEAGNEPVKGAVIWTALSLITLLGGIAAAVYTRDRYPSAAWVSGISRQLTNQLVPGRFTPAQKALGKFCLVVGVLFFGQTLLGGAVAHYRAEPSNFYGLHLETIFPSNLLRAWHLECAIFWIATAYVAATLFMGITLRRRHEGPGGLADSALLKWLVNILFVAFAIVIFGSIFGTWAGMTGALGQWWDFLGGTGWEYLEPGKIWHVLFLVGMLVWFALLFWIVQPVMARDLNARPLIIAMLLATLAIPLFYAPVLLIGMKTNFSVVELWRFWLIHLWVEGYLEFFATTLVAVLFWMLGIARRNVALKVILFDGILYFLGGVLGTCHHWYFTGQSQALMAIGAVMSAMEVVPLTLLAAEAWDFVNCTRLDQHDGQVTHKWVFYFLMACGFWNFVGAGICGFLINTPIVSYFEVGTMLTPNHGHAAMMGTFGMLSLAMVVLVLQQISTPARWAHLQKFLKVAFWGTNIGLALMVALSLFPGGLCQVWDVMVHGYWHARSTLYTRSSLAVTLEWLRMLGDVVFIAFGSLPICAFVVMSWLGLWGRDSTGDTPHHALSTDA
ncbi:nitric-oxide reductase large subunit [Formicincola oecophyllae]|uniref:Nitric-oxide reductase large subunit n=2 Tax=Formicincola oecophyllae TaxID=2558361 RepID=A0A4Y6UAI8_9PROT|nr:nitric-oxide reductase large subunit [Formicincola oecophyllae]